MGRCGLALSRSYTPFPGVTATTQHSWEEMLSMGDLVVPGKDLATSCFTTEQGELNVQLTKIINSKAFSRNWVFLCKHPAKQPHHQNGFGLLPHKNLLLGPQYSSRHPTGQSHVTGNGKMRNLQAPQTMVHRTPPLSALTSAACQEQDQRFPEEATCTSPGFCLLKSNSAVNRVLSSAAENKLQNIIVGTCSRNFRTARPFSTPDCCNLPGPNALSSEQIQH